MITGHEVTGRLSEVLIANGFAFQDERTVSARERGRGSMSPSLATTTIGC